jgi:hypothetical protein
MPSLQTKLIRLEKDFCLHPEPETGTRNLLLVEEAEDLLLTLERESATMRTSPAPSPAGRQVKSL